MRSLLITAEAVARAALMREESRGAHTRLDFPGESEEWVQVQRRHQARRRTARWRSRSAPKPEGPPAPRRDRERQDRGPRGRQGRRGR